MSKDQNNLTEDKQELFLIELEKITRSTGLAIGGCGCCVSPYLYEITKEQLSDDHGYRFGSQEEISWSHENNGD